MGDAARKTRNRYRSGFCTILSPRGANVACSGLFFDLCPPTPQGSPPNLTQIYFLFRPILRFRVHPPTGLPSPNWPLDIIDLGTLVQTNFVGGIAPHLGEIWGVKIFDRGVLWPRFSRNSLIRFWNFSAPRQVPPPLDMLKI